MKGILGRKIGMTQTFAADGKLIPVTVIEVQPNVVTKVLTQDSDGYQALQLSVEDKRANLTNKPDAGQFQKAGTSPKRFTNEIRNMEGFELGAEVKADLFSAGEFVDVTGISKGKGFSGVIKRWNQRRGPMGHGSGYHRGIGGMGTMHGKVKKNKKMAGQYGHEQVTIQNLEVVKIDLENNTIQIKGSIPGPKKSFVVIKEAVKGIESKDAIQLAEVKGE